MKTTGRIRSVDDIGRLVLPKEIRLHCGLHEFDQVEFFKEADCVFLKKKQPTCVFCEQAGEMIYKEKPVCTQCLHNMAQLLVQKED